nr:Apoptosis-inducing factor 2 [Polyrhizophydium stewartii]
MSHKRIVILGANSGGASVADILKKKLTAAEATLTIVDKYSKRFNVTATPRGLVDADFAEKQFVGWDRFFEGQPGFGKFVHGKAVSVLPSEVVLESGERIPFDFLVVATGSSYALVGTAQSNSVEENIDHLRRTAADVAAANRIVIVGGGSVGIELAGEIKHKHPTKSVTILHAENKLALGDTSDGLQTRVINGLKKAGVELHMGDKVTTAFDPSGIRRGSHTVATEGGKTFESDLTIFAVGFGRPNSDLIATLPGDSHTDGKGFIRVKPTLQIASDEYPNIFSLGNVAATGAALTSLNASKQAEIVTGNIIALLRGKPLENFTIPKQNLIIVTLGPQTAFGEIPMVPNFMADFIGRTMKSPHLFNDRITGEQGLKYSPRPSPKRIVILGGSYGGTLVARRLEGALTPEEATLTLVDKYSKRFNIVGSPRGLFAGWDRFFEGKPGFGKFVHGKAVSVLPSEVVLESGERIPFDFLVVATGSSYALVGTAQSNSVEQNIDHLRRTAADVATANRIVIVGGGSVGIELAGEIKHKHPTKSVTILHAENKLALGDTSDGLQTRVINGLKKAGVELHMGDKVTTAFDPSGIRRGSHTVATEGGKTFESDLTIFAVGFGRPNSDLIATLPGDSHTDGKGFIKVKPTLQIASDEYPNIFSLGTVAAFPTPVSVPAIRARECLPARRTAYRG